MNGQKHKRSVLGGVEIGTLATAQRRSYLFYFCWLKCTVWLDSP